MTCFWSTLLFKSSVEIVPSMGLNMSINMGDEQNIPPDEEACREKGRWPGGSISRDKGRFAQVGCSRLREYEELRADLLSEPTTAKHWRMNREKLEADWERKISDDECK